jgi:hypothetical protein
LIHLVCLVLCGLIFVPRYGAFGAALAWLTGNMIGIPVLVMLVNRYVLEFPSLTMAKETLARPCLAFLMTLFAALAISPLVHGTASLAMAVTIITTLYGALAYLMAFNSTDQRIIKSFAVSRYRAVFPGGPGIAKEQV